MIANLEIQNFKCFQQAKSFDFAKVNLLTGINGRGKSTLLQAILLLSQTAWKSSDFKKLIINDDILELGNFDDIKNSETSRIEKVIFKIKFGSEKVDEVEFQYAEDPDQELLADLENINITSDYWENLNQKLASILRRIHFVSANRLGPVKYVEKTTLPEFIHVGPKGENTINILANSINIGNVDERLYLGSDARSIIQQTTEWLDYILDGAKIDIKGKDKDSSVLNILLNNKKNSYNYKPINVGFGYSYILPLIVTGLIAKPGDIIIIENPEAHLHPKGQSKISEFFARVASCGIQIFIESHSEHILNGLRVSVLNPEIDIKYDDLAIHYFNESFNFEKLTIDSRGKIANWPNGFFDQQEIDLSNIFRYTK